MSRDSLGHINGLKPVRGIKESQLSASLRVCESVAARNGSSLYRVSQHMRDPCRYEAFLAMYSVMREIDDFVDALPNPGRANPAQLSDLEKELDRWQSRIERAYAGKPGQNELEIALSCALMSFDVPILVWHSFLRSMRYDLHYNSFKTWKEFIRYADGATVAPTSIFILLLCSRTNTEDALSSLGRPIRYEVKDIGDGFNYRACAQDLGMFAYLTHILRDVREDIKIGTEGRVYIPISDLRKAGLSVEEFRHCVRSGNHDSRWNQLVHLVTHRARSYERAGVRKAKSRYPAMEPDCRLILSLIIAMYQDLLGRIESAPDSVLSGDDTLG